MDLCYCNLSATYLLCEPICPNSIEIVSTFMQNCIQPVKNTLSKLFLNCSMTLSNQTTWTAYNQWKILGDFWKRSSFHRINCHYIISEQILGLQLQSLSILHFWKIVSYKADLQATITTIKTPIKPTKQGKIDHYLLRLMLWLLSLHCHQCPFFPHVHFLWLPLQ